MRVIIGKIIRTSGARVDNASSRLRNDGVCTIRRVSHIDAPEGGCWVSPGDWSVGYVTGVLTGKSEMTMAVLMRLCARENGQCHPR